MSIMQRVNFFKTHYGDGVFVESGTYEGEGVFVALTAGFKKIISYEVDEKLYKECKETFSDNKNVQILHKTSAKMFDEIQNIDERITFWLDGHYSGGKTSFVDKKCPILEELNEIKKHKRNDHIIIIDDIRLFGTEEFDFISLEEVTKKLLEINPNYKITKVVHHYEILVATL